MLARPNPAGWQSGAALSSLAHASRWLMHLCADSLPPPSIHPHRRSGAFSAASTPCWRAGAGSPSGEQWGVGDRSVRQLAWWWSHLLLPHSCSTAAPAHLSPLPLPTPCAQLRAPQQPHARPRHRPPWHAHRRQAVHRRRLPGKSVLFAGLQGCRPALQRLTAGVAGMHRMAHAGLCPPCRHPPPSCPAVQVPQELCDMPAVLALPGVQARLQAVC